MTSNASHAPSNWNLYVLFPTENVGAFLPTVEIELLVSGGGITVPNPFILLLFFNMGMSLLSPRCSTVPDPIPVALCLLSKVPSGPTMIFLPLASAAFVSSGNFSAASFGLKLPNVRYPNHGYLSMACSCVRFPTAICPNTIVDFINCHPTS